MQTPRRQKCNGEEDWRALVWRVEPVAALDFCYIGPSAASSRDAMILGRQTGLTVLAVRHLVMDLSRSNLLFKHSKLLQKVSLSSYRLHPTRGKQE